MEDQGKRLLLAVVAAIGIFFLWQAIFPPKKEEPPPSTGSGSGSALVQNTSANPIGKPAAAGSGSAAQTAGAAPVAVTHPRNPADEIDINDYPQLHAVFTKWGGRLISWQLKDERYLTTKEHGELIASVPGKTSKDAAVPYGAFDLNFASSALTIPADAEWSGTRKGDVITYVYDGDKMTVTKKYTLYPADYLIKLEIDVVAKKAPADPQPVYAQQLAISVYGYQDEKDVVTVGRTKRQWQVGCLANGSVEEKPIAEIGSEWKQGGTITWTGAEHPYLLLAMAPKDAGNETLNCLAYPGGAKGLAQIALVYESANLKGGDTYHRELWAYAGPKNVDKLEHADDVAGFQTGFKKSVSMGWFSFIARPLLWLLLQFYALVGNWGLAIIMLTVCVKLATLYWTTKSMRSMRAMASLKPKMDELQKKYADDRARQQQEMMALYKTHGVNPLAGCLPILLQMPIWLALYRMLSNAGELYNAPFVPGWIDDLTAKDPYYILGIALVILMFVQAKLQPATGDGMQQKIMMYVLPGVFGVMSLFFPSGLTLYILTNTILTALHSIYMRKWDKSAKLMQAAGAAAVPAGVKRVEREVPKARVVDVKADAERDASADEDDDASDDGDDEAERSSSKGSAAPKAQSSNKNANRQRRGKRRGGRN